MTYTFELKTADGGDAGALRTSQDNWMPGDIVIAPGNRRYNVTEVLPLAKVEELARGFCPSATDLTQRSIATITGVNRSHENAPFPAHLVKADDGTRTHDLLHGKQTL
jgi:hypothetical protein